MLRWTFDIPAKRFTGRTATFPFFPRSLVQIAFHDTPAVLAGTAIQGRRRFHCQVRRQRVWERHPKGDEIVQIIDGTTTLQVVRDNRSEDFTLSAGAFVVIPQGAWHRFESAEGVSLMTATPEPSEFTTVDDPSLLGS